MLFDRSDQSWDRTSSIRLELTTVRLSKVRLPASVPATTRSTPVAESTSSSPGPPGPEIFKR